MIINQFHFSDFFSSDWSIEELLAEQGLCCNFIRCVDTDQHSVCLGKITQSIEAIGRMSEAEGPKVFAGVEGYFKQGRGGKLGQKKFIQMMNYVGVGNCESPLSLWLPHLYTSHPLPFYSFIFASLPSEVPPTPLWFSSTPPAQNSANGMMGRD